MGFRRPEVQILSPRPRWSRVCIACSDFLQRSACAHRAAALSSPGRPAERPPRPAARGRLSCSAFSSFSFVKASREEVGGGPILSLPFPFDPLSRKRTENGPPGSSACRRDRRPERAGGRGAGQIGRGRRRPGRRADRQGHRRRDKRGSVDGYKRAGRKSPPGSCAGFRRCRTPKRVPARQASGRGRRRRWRGAGDAKEPGGEGRPAPVPDGKPRALPDTEERAGDRRTDAQRARQTGGSRRAGAQAGIRSRFPLIPSQEKELKTGGSRGRARARAGGETGGRAGGGGAGGGTGWKRREGGRDGAETGGRGSRRARRRNGRPQRRDGKGGNGKEQRRPTRVGA